MGAVLILVLGDGSRAGGCGLWLRFLVVGRVRWSGRSLAMGGAPHGGNRAHRVLRGLYPMGERGWIRQGV